MIATDEHFNPNKILFFDLSAFWDADGVALKWHRPKRITPEEYPEVVARIPAEVNPFPPEAASWIYGEVKVRPEKVAPKRWSTGTILRDERDTDPARRYKTIHLHTCGADGYPAVPPWTRCFYTRFSADGETWSDPKPMAGFGETGDTQALIYDERANLYRFFTRPRGYWIPGAGETVPEFLKTMRKKRMPDGRWIAMTTSADFGEWSPLDLIVEKNPRDEPDIEFYCMLPFPYGDQYLGLLRRFHAREGTMDTELIRSPDCLRWQRAYQLMSFTSPGDLGEFDFCFGNLANQRPFRCDDTLYFLYEGREHIHAPHGVKGNEHEGELDQTNTVCTMRVDGFASIDTGRMGGHLTTEPWPIAGKSLFLNARTVKDGFIRIALLAPDLTPINAPEFVFSGDSIATLIRFGDTDTLPASPDGTLRLRITMENAALYSFTIGGPA